MPLVPLLVGSRPIVAVTGDDDVVLRPPAPGGSIADVGSAVCDALRFPLSGEPLETLARGARRAAIVVEAPALPLPGSERDPRQLAIEATVEELERLGVPSGFQTILVTAGLGRRPGRRETSALVRPEFARRFHGQVVVHDVESDDLVPLDGDGRIRASRVLVETDLVVTVSAAESVVHGGPALLRGVCSAALLRSAAAQSLLETGASRGWEDGVAVERALARRVPVIGVSLVLDHPRYGGALRGFPYRASGIERVARSPLRRGFSYLPSPLRVRFLRTLRNELTAAGVLAGPPSVAHAEALLRAIELRSAVLDGQLDAIVIALPHTTATLPRERPNPLQSTYIGLALALRMWRDAFPVADGGTVILVSGFQRRFRHPTQAPYRAFFAAVRHGREPEELRAAERAAAADERARDAYRAGQTCHPLQPFSDWAACAPALGRLGNVVVAGCRDATAARQLGFVESHSLGAALGMVHGLAEGAAPRIGWLLSPPYFPLRVKA